MPAEQKDTQDPFNTKRPIVYTLKGHHKLLFYPLACLLWLYLRSLRIRIDPQDMDTLSKTSRPRMIVFWHNRSLVAVEVVRNLFSPDKFSALISPSKMAAWEVALFEFLNFLVIRGSTTRRSIQASIEILRSFKEGNDVSISPDGPSGPLYSFQPGATALARKAGVPVLLIVPNCSFARRLNSWDRHLVPFPFAKVHLEIKVIQPDDPVWESSNEEASEQFKRVCLEMTDDPF